MAFGVRLKAGKPQNMELNGRSLSPEILASVSKDGTTLSFSPNGRTMLDRSRAIIDKAIADAVPIYGVTTGLGSRATEALNADALSGFSVETLNGRAHALPPALPRSVVRAAMAVRLNTFLIGAAGVSPAVAEHLRLVFNAGLTPVVGRWGTIGAADLLLGATMGRAVMGLGGRLADQDGVERPAADAMAEGGLTPPALGPRDGLALANHACFSAALAGLAVAEARRALQSQTSVAALSFFAFGGNVTPLDPSVLKLKPHSHDARVAGRFLTLLEGSPLADPANARRLQDPISIRNAVQVLGSAERSLAEAADVMTTELNAASDNPAVLVDEGRVVSTGNYHTPHLTLACDYAGRGLAATATLSTARIARLCTERLTGLPQYLADPEVGTNGFAPLLKLAESLLGGIQHLTQPTAVWPSINADGVEDGLTLALLSASNFMEAASLSRRITALEALVAAQACDLRGAKLPHRLSDLHEAIRAVSPRIRESRPLADDIERVAEAI